MVPEVDPVHDVALHRVEERLHMRVVRDLPRSVHALHKAQGRQPMAEGVCRIRDPPVAVEDDAGARAPVGDGMVERPERQPRILLRPQAPAQDAPGVAIHDHGQVPPRARHLQIREVADPDLIRPRGQAIEAWRLGMLVKNPWSPGIRR